MKILGLYSVLLYIYCVHIFFLTIQWCEPHPKTLTELKGLVERLNSTPPLTLAGCGLQDIRHCAYCACAARVHDDIILCIVGLCLGAGSLVTSWFFQAPPKNRDSKS